VADEDVPINGWGIEGSALMVFFCARDVGVFNCLCIRLLFERIDA